MHILSLTAPGVQMFDADTATELAALANDRLAAVCARHPDRFAGLACFAPQAPKRAAKEMERAIRVLKLNGFILNSHTLGEYLDDPKFWPVLEVAEALDLHSSTRRTGFAQRPVAGLRHGFSHVGLWGGSRHARRAHDGCGRIRSLSQA
jgi:predicted TIM-barrel fold metal-dependent hydrolase